jgi:hypothetical protein
MPALVDGQPVITPEPNSGMSEGRKIFLSRRAMGGESFQFSG